jgi:hypothetical protein
MRVFLKKVFFFLGLADWFTWPRLAGVRRRGLRPAGSSAAGGGEARGWAGSGVRVERGQWLVRARPTAGQAAARQA